MTFNYHSPRFEEKEKSFLTIIRNAFPNSKCFKYIAFIHTRVYGYIPKEHKTPKILQKRKEGVIKKMNYYFTEINDEYINAIPQIFIDSLDSRESFNDSTIQVCELLAWASGLKHLNEELPEMSLPLEEPQQETRIRKECAPSLPIWHKGHKTLGIGRSAYTEYIPQEYIMTEERTIQKMTDKSIKLIKDWHEIKKGILKKQNN